MALDAIIRRLRPADFRRYALGEQAPIRWTVKELLAHITAWKWRDVRRITKDRGPVKPYEAPYATNGRAPNAMIYDRARRTPARTIVAEHRAAHRAILKALREAPPEHFAKRWSPHWPADTVGHVASHRRMHLDPLFPMPRSANEGAARGRYRRSLAKS